jgi:hypothetical protein
MQNLTITLTDFRDETKNVSGCVLFESNCVPRLGILCFFGILFEHEVSKILHGVLHVKPAKLYEVATEKMERVNIRPLGVVGFER